MIRYEFPPIGGTPWHDLEEDRPWFDECAEADYLQDREEAWAANPPAAADVAGERFGPLTDILAEAPPDLLDNDLTRHQRRKILNEALEADPTIIYRRGSGDRASATHHRDMAG